MNLLQSCIPTKPSTESATIFYVSHDDDDDTEDLDVDSLNFKHLRKGIESKVAALMDENISDEEQITLFADVMKQVALCSDFNANHVAFLDTIWTRSREAIHQRQKSLRHYDADSQSIRLNIETDLLYKEMRAELMEIVARRSSVSVQSKGTMLATTKEATEARDEF